MSVMTVNNEIGVKQPIQEIGQSVWQILWIQITDISVRVERRIDFIPIIISFFYMYMLFTFYHHVYIQSLLMGLRYI